LGAPILANWAMTGALDLSVGSQLVYWAVQLLVPKHMQEFQKPVTHCSDITIMHHTWKVGTEN